MATSASKPAATAAPTVLSAADLKGGAGAFCPHPRMALWSTHPRVYIHLDAQGQGRCPYCGTQYQVAVGAAHPAH